MNHNVTLIGINYYPEDTAIGLYSTQMMEYLAKKGTNVSIVTGFPYYPQWKIWENYEDKSSRVVEKQGDITVYRYKQYTPANPSFKNRIVHLLDFTLGSF